MRIGKVLVIGEKGGEDMVKRFYMGLILGVFILSGYPSYAKQEYADATGQACSICHQNPQGGGPLTDFGKGFQGSIHPKVGKTGLEELAGGSVALPWEEFKGIVDWQNLREAYEGGIISLPWQEIQEILKLETEPLEKATVKLPWQEFKKMLVWSIQKKVGPKPPQDYVISRAIFDGSATKKGADFALSVTVYVLDEEKWLTIPLLPATVAVKEAKLPEGAFLSMAGGGWYNILTKGGGKLEATLYFSVAINESQGIWSMSFQKAPAGTNKLHLIVKEKDINATVPSAESVMKTEKPEGLELEAAISGERPISVSWEKAMPEVEKIPAKLFSECKTLVSVGDGILTSHSRLSYQILHAGIRELKVIVPEGSSVLSVTGSRLRDWRTTGNTIQIQLGYEALGTYELDIMLEQPMVVGSETILIPVVRAEGVEIEKGFIGVVAVSNVEISSGKITSASSIDVRDLPPEIFAMTTQPVIHAYRYLAGDFQIALNIKKHEDVPVLLTIADSSFATTMQTADGRRITRIVYNVRNNRNQFLRLRIPEGFDVWSTSVSGKSTKPAMDEEENILIPLIRSGSAGEVMSAFPVEVVYVEKNAEIRPTGKGSLKIELPAVDVPITHMMWDLYLPAEGKYDKKSFSGPMKLVDQYLDIKTGKPVLETAQQAQVLQQQVVQRVEEEAKAAGVTPIRVELPLNGQVFHLEKILVLQEPLWVELDYTNVGMKGRR